MRLRHGAPTSVHVGNGEAQEHELLSNAAAHCESFDDTQGGYVEEHQQSARPCIGSSRVAPKRCVTQPTPGLRRRGRGSDDIASHLSRSRYHLMHALCAGTQTVAIKLYRLFANIGHLSRTDSL